MRILIATLGSLGDLHPFFAIGLELQRRGHQVVIASNELYREKIEQAGLEFHAVRPDWSKLGLGQIQEVAKLGLDEKDGARYIMEEIILPHLQESFDDLRSGGCLCDGMVVGANSLTASMVAGKLQLPWISTALSPIHYLSTDEPLAVPTQWGVVRLTDNPFFNTILRELAKLTAIPWNIKLNQFRKANNLPMLLDPIFEGSRLSELDLALFSPCLVPSRTCLPEQTQVVGFPWYDSHHQYTELSGELREFLEKGTPVIVFTLGSSAVMSAGRFYDFSAAASQILGERAVLLTGDVRENIPTSYLSDRLICVPYAPHSLLFPYARAIVHHGGIGTTGQVLRAGKSSLIVPFGQDQFDNARRVEQLGVARVLPYKNYETDTVVRELRQLLKGDYSNESYDVGQQVQKEDGATKAANLIESHFQKQIDSRPLTEIGSNLKIACPNTEEAKVLYQQVQSYFQNGLEFSPGGVIFDVGANIGLFSLLAYQQCYDNASIYAFEPIPEIFRYLKLNLQRLTDTHSFARGLGEMEQNIEFTYFPKSTPLSTRYSENLELERYLYRETLKDFFSELPYPWQAITYLPEPLKSLILDRLIQDTLQPQIITRQIRTISQIMSEYSIKEINLLKIDVEKSELDVLEGIQEEHWPLIKQIAVEVHDIKNRVSIIHQMLQKQGFNTTTTQEPYFKKLGVFTIYAKR